MDVKVYGCNHIAIEVDDVERAVAFYQDGSRKLISIAFSSEPEPVPAVNR